MAAWLPTVDGRFRAAVSASPVTDWYSERFDGLGSWAADYVGGEPLDVPEAYVRQSPVLAKGHRHATLLTAGLHDRATPVGQATKLLPGAAWSQHAGTPRVVRYPQEGASRVPSVTVWPSSFARVASVRPTTPVPRKPMSMSQVWQLEPGSRPVSTPDATRAWASVVAWLSELRPHVGWAHSKKAPE